MVFFDPTGQGDSEQGQVLDISPQALEDYITAFDFLTWMTQRIHDFWDQQRTTIQQAFRTTFINQALISLKRGSLTRGTFDLLVDTLAHPAPHNWRSLGFSFRAR